MPGMRIDAVFLHQLFTKIPVRITPLILAGIRADKYHHLTFPCNCTVVLRDGCHNSSMTTCTPLRGQHISVYPEPDSSARLTGEQVRYTSCFPFNRRHDHVREHQNFAILMAEPQCSKVGAAAVPCKATDNAFMADAFSCFLTQINALAVSEIS